jgi:hypothetical protein
MLNRTSIAVVVALLVSAALNPARAQFQPGEFITYSQVSWGGDPSIAGSAAALVAERFYFVYPWGSLEIGVQGISGFSLFFTSSGGVLHYLPTSGIAAPLNADLVDPSSTASGAFGGDVLALQLNVDFADAAYLAGSAGVLFGDLKLVNMKSVTYRDLSEFNGWTVRQWLEFAKVALGTGGGTIDFDTLSYLTEDLTSAFEGGQPSQFAQEHLRFMPPGDFDEDGDADGADFLKWQQALGSADPMVDGNGNNNGVVDGWDLAIWASNFGAAASGPSVVVPEPAAWALGAMSLATLGWRRRHAPKHRGP